MAQRITCLLRKEDGQSLDPQNPSKAELVGAVVVGKPREEVDSGNPSRGKLATLTSPVSEL